MLDYLIGFSLGIAVGVTITSVISFSFRTKIVEQLKQPQVIKRVVEMIRDEQKKALATEGEEWFYGKEESK